MVNSAQITKEKRKRAAILAGGFGHNET